MSFRAVDHSVNIIAYEKNTNKYAMCCAWSMMVDYDKLLCLLGSQSVTGKNIQKGDIIGVSSLGKDQKDIALALGENHSNEMDKLKGISYTMDKSAILISNARTEMVCEVMDVFHLKQIEEDFLIYLKIVDYKESKKQFLHMEDF